MSLSIQKQSQDKSQNVQNGQHEYEHHENGHRTSQSWHAPHDGKRVSEEDYWKFYYEKGHVEGDASYEWNNGTLEAKPMASQRQARLYNWFLEILRHFLRENPVALMMNLEIGFRMKFDDANQPGDRKVSNHMITITVQQLHLSKQLFMPKPKCWFMRYWTPVQM